MYFHNDLFRAFPGFSKLEKNPGATSKPVANGATICHSRNKEALNHHHQLSLSQQTIDDDF